MDKGRVRSLSLCLTFFLPLTAGEDELDLHVCGKCRAEFTNIDLYVDHKRDGCSKRTSSKSTQDSPRKVRVPVASKFTQFVSVFVFILRLASFT